MKKKKPTPKIPYKAKKAPAKAKAKPASRAPLKKSPAKKVPTAKVAPWAEISAGIVHGIKSAIPEILEAISPTKALEPNLDLAYKRTDFSDTQSSVLAFGHATGALGNGDFIKYLNERGITDAEIKEVRDALLKLARAFYVDPEAERE